MPERASARLLWRVLAETFLRGGRHARDLSLEAVEGIVDGHESFEVAVVRGALHFGRKLAQLLPLDGFGEPRGQAQRAGRVRELRGHGNHLAGHA